MCTLLVRYVQCYLAPSNDEEDKRFVQQLETLVQICIKKLLACYVSFMDYQRTIIYDDDFKVVQSTMDSALRVFFPLSFLSELDSYRAQFIFLDNAVVTFSLRLPIETSRHFLENLEVLAKKSSRAIECLILRIAELYFLSDNVWCEIQKDDEIVQILRRLGVYEHVSFKDIDRTSFLEAELSKHAEQLIDSYLVALIRRLNKCTY
jgi:hypothetical protein